MISSKRGRILKATAGESIAKGDKITLVSEASAISLGQVLTAYLMRAEGHYHGIALNTVALGEELSFEERIIQNDVPLPPVPERSFTPVTYPKEGYGLFLLNISLCPICKRPMMEKGTGLFPEYHRFNQDTQMKQAGIVFIGAEIPGLDKNACEICTKEGRITFVCALCGETRTSDLLHEDYHDEPLCEVCFETRSAKEWEAKQDEIREAHKYDYD